MAQTLMRTVRKRSGLTVPYDTKKIYKAIAAANKDAGGEMKRLDINQAVLQTDIALQGKPQAEVEDVQDIVENILMKNNFYETARQYIRYRQIHEQRRKANAQLMVTYNDMLFADSKDVDLKRDNANINTDAPMGIMLKLGTEGAKSYVDNYVLDEEVLAADKAGAVHIHKLNCGFAA